MSWIRRTAPKVSKGPKCPKCETAVPAVAPPPHEVTSGWSGKMTHELAKCRCGENLVDWEWRDDD